TKVEQFNGIAFNFYIFYCSAIRIFRLTPKSKMTSCFLVIIWQGGGGLFISYRVNPFTSRCTKCFYVLPIFLSKWHTYLLSHVSTFSPTTWLLWLTVGYHRPYSQLQQRFCFSFGGVYVSFLYHSCFTLLHIFSLHEALPS